MQNGVFAVSVVNALLHGVLKERQQLRLRRWVHADELRQTFADVWAVIDELSDAVQEVPVDQGGAELGQDPAVPAHGYKKGERGDECTYHHSITAVFE